MPRGVEIAMDPGAQRRAGRWHAGTVTLLLLQAAGCGLPLDPDGTFDRVRGGTMRVGIVHHPPWVDVRGEGGPNGTEIELISELADGLGARVEWEVGGETELMTALERRRLDLVAGGIAEETAWKGKVGLSKPHAQVGDRGIVLASPPGENGWLLHLDRWIGRRETTGEG